MSTPNFAAFIEEARTMASAKGIHWEMRMNRFGRIYPPDAWNLTKMSGGSPPPAHWLYDLGFDTKTLDVINTTRVKEGKKRLSRRPISRSWQDLIKACVLDQLFIRRNTPAYVLSSIARPLRVLATAVEDCDPWRVTGDAATVAHEIAKEVQAGGKLAELVFGVINTVLDRNHLTEITPLSSTLSRNVQYRSKQARFTKSVDELRRDLEDRKRAQKLPERRAFWELVRIVFTERPDSFLDLLRFALVRVILLTGFRVGEAVKIPADWKRFRDHYDARGRPAGELGGYSRSLMLRHFAEKSRTIREDSVALFEATQHVPPMFEEILVSTLDQVVEVTGPLRRMLKRQVETGRIFPDFAPRDLVPVTELFTRLTGNPFVANVPRDVQSNYAELYRADYRPEIFDELHRLQAPLFAGQKGVGMKALNKAAYMYFCRFDAALLRTAEGTPHPGRYRPGYGPQYVRIGELEKQFAAKFPTKQSDSIPLKLVGGELQAWELGFLAPKRAVAEGRNEGLCDVTRYCAVGRFDPSMVTDCISGESHTTLFEAYGQNDEDRQLRLNPHQLRHLQNTELFRLGVADTTITKRFDRRSVPQTHEYDHRNLAEHLGQIELPPEIEAQLGEKSATVARMILAGKANGPIVEAFRRIQREEGDDAAFQYLKVEADGFHSTPYGHCLNSFTVDPCPKHLECFVGCRHLSATNLPANRRNLIQLEGRLETAVRTVEAKQSGSIGRENQLQHAQTRLEGVRKLLATPVGDRVFPDGPDLSVSESTIPRSVLDGQT